MIWLHQYTTNQFAKKGTNGLTNMLDRCNQGSKNDQHWHLTAKELLWVPWTYNFVSNTSCCMQWPWTRTMSQERFITPLLVLCVQLFTLDHRKTTKSVIINTAEDISPWHKYLCFGGNMSFLCSRQTTDINFLNIRTSCNWQMIFFASRQRLNASYWCLQCTLPFARPQSNLHIPRADPGSKKHISHFTLCCSGGERQRSFFPFLLDWCIHSLGSELEIQNQKMYRKKWQHIAIFCFTGLVSCVKGKAILVVLHPSGAFIEPNPERIEWICFPGSQIYESSIFLSFFLSFQNLQYKKTAKRRSGDRVAILHLRNISSRTSDH